MKPYISIKEQQDNKKFNKYDKFFINRYVPSNYWVHGNTKYDKLVTFHAIECTQNWDIAWRYSLYGKGGIWLIQPKSNSKVVDMRKKSNRKSVINQLEKDYFSSKMKNEYYYIKDVLDKFYSKSKLLFLWAWVSFFAYALKYSLSLVVVSKWFI